ncbi:hypothetical protein CALCODRAFT_504943 [Calocera cornea HHB12733]|uniref:Thioredoxin-like fold domain-containing protein n=1 Tax=Calocera cornea HHB12733 TaxID=1353952 RepID=A0A165C4J4_9BASI|nr:hypothetical protein CALCODRAFT_504943 [Calocera cornea HHB12733]
MAVELHAVPTLASQPSTSYYCQKLDTYLRAVGYADYTLSADLPHNGPKGKVPWVVSPSGEWLPDSYFILRRLLADGTIRDVDVDAGLSPAARADARAWVCQVYELIYPTTLCERFLVPANFAQFSAQVFDGVIPWLIRGPIVWYVGRSGRVNLWGQGVARHSEQEREMILAEFVGNAVARMGKEGYLFGAEPCSADVALYAWCANCLQTQGNPHVKAQILASERLKEYIGALTERWFPEYVELLQLVQEK